ncbi:Trans-aconitate 2-methyltransferase [Aquicella siphonis]|uniref:Trans-aconitate 2-methyltransferase n=1 Tax=Aquicella siphonis TaxID=254247 RepID=A0A5E4PFL8_9COXI|nr:class I SAM-dependent methyltransferase [Aquicella siphonis]VVC75780.1 Trans-aconitate 2-methyltransferase [Aquicella siphonis]
MQNQNWDHRYREHDTPWERGKPDIEMQRLFTAYIHKNAHVLEIGCGYGTNARWLAEAGYHVTAVDISSTAIEQAKKLTSALDLTLQFKTLDFMREWQSLPQFDAVFDSAVFHFMETSEARHLFARHIASLLHDKGWWINIACSQDQANEISAETGVRPPPNLKARDIVEAAEPYFEIIDMHRCFFQVDRRESGKALFNAWGSAFRKRG